MQGPPAQPVAAPSTQMTPVGILGPTTAAGYCRYEGGCYVLKDPCYDAFKASYVANASFGGMCPAGCWLFRVPPSMALNAQNASTPFAPLLVANSSGFGVCIDDRLWSRCSQGVQDPYGCSMVVNGSQLCQFVPVCRVPPQSNFGCSNKDDVCCMSSNTPYFLPEQAKHCSSRKGEHDLYCLLLLYSQRGSDDSETHDNPAMSSMPGVFACQHVMLDVRCCLQYAK